jgi:CubicO group peptidase (beta-lactamase class C family)
MKRPGLLLLLVALVAPAGGAAAQTMSGAEPGPAAEQVAPVIETYRQVIREQMKAQRIPGIAIALVTGDDVLWSEGFGCTDRSCRSPVTVATPFSIQSMSKAVTATAVMLAVQDGVLDLDTPISVYLPGFTVRSVFDERPQGLITLRMLLSHTAGFDHEAPVGNNYDPEPGSWEEHVASISRTYLRFPVGRHWAYSNLGIDLAGAALERKTDVPFHEYVERRVFAPLGMASSTMDRAAILAMPHRAVGHESIFRDIPVVPMMASGGCYTTASDLAAFVRFHLNRGAAGGVTLLDPALLEILYAPQFSASAPHNYGLGLVARPSPRGVLEVSHSGGGFGFLSQMKWYPALGLGVAWVSNSTGHDLQSWLTDAILGDVIAAAGDILSPLVTAHPYVERPHPTAPDAIAGDTLAAWIRSLAMDGGPDAHRRRGGYAGTYGLSVWGRVVELVRIAGHSPLTLDGRPLYEVRPGLYLSESGEALDLTTGTATWRNIPPRRPGSLPTRPDRADRGLRGGASGRHPLGHRIQHDREENAPTGARAGEGGRGRADPALHTRPWCAAGPDRRWHAGPVPVPDVRSGSPAARRSATDPAGRPGYPLPGGGARGSIDGGGRCRVAATAWTPLVQDLGDDHTRGPGWVLRPITHMRPDPLGHGEDPPRRGRGGRTSSVRWAPTSTMRPALGRGRRRGPCRRRRRGALGGAVVVADTPEPWARMPQRMYARKSSSA